jgi:hypothetical protein
LLTQLFLVGAVVYARTAFGLLAVIVRIGLLAGVGCNRKTWLILGSEQFFFSGLYC